MVRIHNFGFTGKWFSYFIILITNCARILLFHLWVCQSARYILSNDFVWRFGCSWQSTGTFNWLRISSQNNVETISLFLMTYNHQPKGVGLCQHVAFEIRLHQKRHTLKTLAKSCCESYHDGITGSTFQCGVQSNTRSPRVHQISVCSPFHINSTSVWLQPTRKLWKGNRSIKYCESSPKTITGWWCNNHLEKSESQWEGLSHIWNGK